MVIVEDAATPARVDQPLFFAGLRRAVEPVSSTGSISASADVGLRRHVVRLGAGPSAALPVAAAVLGARFTFGASSVNSAAYALGPAAPNSVYRCGR